MKTLTQEKYDRIKHLLPIQRGNVTIDNIRFINALLYICENGCKWRRIPEEYGNWHVIYKRFRRWVEDGVIANLFNELHAQNILSADVEALFMDSRTVKVHPDACGALKKTENNQSVVPKAD